VWGGKTGWVGQMVIASLQNAGHICKSATSRMQNREAVQEEIEDFQPTRIINCAGVTGKPNVSWCDHNKETTVRANVLGCLTLCDVAFLKGIHVTNLSTGCIYSYEGGYKQLNKFDWEVSDTFTEQDVPNFHGSWYSKTKAYVNNILADSFDNVLTLRLRMPITDDLSPKNFVTKIKNYDRIINVPNSMSVMYDLIPFLLKMSEKQYKGIYNFTNPGVISHNQVLDYFKQIIDPTLTYENFSQAEHDEHVKIPRSNNMLCTHKLEQVARECNLPLPDIHTAVKNCFMRMSESYVNISDKRILLTGGAGFTGCEMVHLLMRKYAHFPNFKLVVVDKMSYNSSIATFDAYLQTPEKFHFVKADIQQTIKMMELMQTHRIDVVLHFAAETHVDHSFKNSITFTTSNVVGTHSLLEAARIYGKLERFQHVSTDEVYGPSLANDASKHENHSILNPTNPYSATKAAAEHLAWSYYYSYKLPVVMTRGSNIYGQRQFPDKVIPKFIQQLINKKKLTVHDDHKSGEMMRSFIHVEDVCSAQEMILQRGNIGQIYNITDHFEITIQDLAHKLVRLFDLGAPANWITYVQGRKFNDMRYDICNNKLVGLGWKPAVKFEEGLARTIEWYQNNPNYWNEDLTLAALEVGFVPTEHMEHSIQKPLKENQKNSIETFPSPLNKILEIVSTSFQHIK